MSTESVNSNEEYFEGGTNRSPTKLQDIKASKSRSGQTYKDFKIPNTFDVKNGKLYKNIDKTTSKEVTSTVPIIDCEYIDIDSKEIYFNLNFSVQDTDLNLKVTAEQITQKRELLNLARKRLDVNDNNASILIEFIAQFRRLNSIKPVKVSTRLGHIGDSFITPYCSDTKVFANDGGFETVLNNFKQKGTTNDYLNKVFNQIKDEPMMMNVFYASCGSILLKYFDVEPFVVDLSGKTSTGKTTALKIASTVWGNSNLYVEWNTTVSFVERYAEFMNSFPLLLDDTSKADKSILGAIVYNHTGGKGKGRSNQKLTVDILKTWQNILISSGEVSLSDYSENKAGMAARVVTLQEAPFKPNYPFIDIYKGLKEAYGTFGNLFHEQFKTDKKRYLDIFEKAQIKYMDKAEDNEVLKRLCRPFAMLETSGKIVNDIEGYEHDYEEHVEIAFKQLIESNVNIDKPKQLLISVLEHLNSHRQHLLNGNSSNQYSYEIGIIKKDFVGIYKDNLHKILKEELNTIIKQWIERGYLITNGSGNQKSVKHGNDILRVYAIKMSVIEELGFEFKIKS